MLLLLVSASFAAAQVPDPAPSVGITAQPGTLVWNSVTVRVSAIDSWPSPGISHIDFYVNGNYTATHNCGFAAQCIYTTSRLSGIQKNESYHAIVYDRSNTVQTQTLNVTFKGPNRPPDLSALPNALINEDSGMNTNLIDLHANVTDDWTAPANLTYTIVGQSNTTVANCSITGNQYIDCTTVTPDAFGTSVITITASDGHLTGTGKFTLTVAPVNDAPVFNTTIPAITFAEDTSYVFNISDYFYDIDNKPAYITYKNSTVPNMTISYQFDLGDNKTEAVLVPAADFNGVLTVNFTAFDGQNYSAPSNNVVITITPVNDDPFFTSGTPPAGAWVNLPYSFQFTAGDVDTGDVLTFYDNTSLFDIDSGSGWVNFTPANTSMNSILITVCDDSGAANNCSNKSIVLNVYNHPPISFSNMHVSPASPATYLQNSGNATSIYFQITAQATTNSSIPLTQNATVDKVWIDFAGQNRSTTHVAPSYDYYAVFNWPAAGNYTYRWHANYTNGLQYSTPWHNYTIDKANPYLSFMVPVRPNGIPYGTPANVSCSANTTQVTPILMRNGTIVANPDISILGAGTYTYFCYVNATQNYTAQNISTNFTIVPAQVNVTLSLQTPLTYGTAANVSCNATPSGVTPTLTRNGAALPGLTDNSILNAGNYTYVCYYNTTQNYTGDNESQVLIVNPVQAVINLTLNGTNGNINVPANTTIIVNASTNVPNATLNWYFNRTLMGTIPPAWNLGPIPAGAHNVTATYAGTPNYLAASATHWIFVAMPPMKMSFNPALGSTINTSFTLSFATTYNTSCRWSLNDSAYANMTNDFTTTGQLTHSGTISGLNLGADTVHVACVGDTTINNTYLNYTVQNIIEQGSALTNGAKANHSILYGTSLNNSTLQSVNATNSVINGSILTKCVVINSTVKNYQGTNCTILNSFVDPPNPGSDLTGSTITGNSQVMNSNVTYSFVDDYSSIDISNVDHSNLTDHSNIDNSTVSYCSLDQGSIWDSTCTNSKIDDADVRRFSNVQNSNITNGAYVFASAVTGSTITGANSSVQYSTITNSHIDDSPLYNVTVTNANITNKVIYSGVITQGNITYNATASGAANVSDVINLAPTASFTFTPSSRQVNQAFTFDASSSTDPNIGGPLNDSIVSYFWNFGDGTTITTTNTTVTHAYSTTGYQFASLTVTDSYGATDYTYTTSIQVTSAGGGGGTTVRRTGGGGGGGGSSFYARTWKINLDERSPEIRTLNRLDNAVITLNNLTYTLRMDGIDRGHVNFTLHDVPYSLINYEIKAIDLDNDGMSEIRIIIMNNYYTRAQMRFDKFEQPMGTGTSVVPFANISISDGGLTQDTAQDETQDEVQDSKIKQTITNEQNATNQITGGATTSWLDSIPKDSQAIGIGITVGVVVVGLIIYFLATMFFI